MGWRKGKGSSSPPQDRYRGVCRIEANEYSAEKRMGNKRLG